jgi:putative aldouronate transport system permease protein
VVGEGHPLRAHRRAVRRDSDALFDVLNNLVMSLFLFLVAYPLYFVLIASVSDPTYVNSGQVLLLPKGLMSLGYERILHDTRILVGYRNTIMYTLVGTSVNVALTLSSGYVFSRKDFKGRKVLLMMFTFTMFFGGGMVPTYLLVKGVGLMNTFWAMVVPNAVSVFNIIIAKTYFETSIPAEMHEAAFMDGCADLRFFFSIALPLSKALAAVMVLFYAVGHWNSFFSALVYLESERMYPLQLVLRNILLVEQSNDAGMLNDVREMIERQKAAELIKYGVIVVSNLPVLMLYPMVQKHFVKGVLVGSLKG